MDACNSSSFVENPVEEIIGMLSFFSVIGTIGNTLVLYVYLKKRHKLASTVFIIALAASDFWTCICVMPYTMVYQKLNYQIDNDILCKLYFFLITCNVPFSAFIMAAIAVDRFLCICRPLTHSLDARRAKITVLCLALFATVFGVITALSGGVYQSYRQKKPPVNSTAVYTPMKCSNCDEDSPENCSTVIVYTGVCVANEIILTQQFRYIYRNIYAGMFLVCFIVVFILYILIYKSVLERRAKRDKERSKTKKSLHCIETSLTEMPATNGMSPEQSEPLESRKQMTDKNCCIREKSWIANIRTALILFVVTVVFVIAFLPSWLMAHRVVKFVPLVFYTYFAYNVCNPIIYAFLNPAFRKELEAVFRCRKLNYNY